jgi:hypothetical protein
MAKYTVAVIGLLLANGKMAKFGDEITDEQIADVDKRVAEGYLKKSSDFKADQKDADADAAKAKADQEAADAHTALLKQYEEAFLVPAPADVDDKAIAKAIKDNKAIGK